MILYECCLTSIIINNVEKYNYYLYNIKQLKEDNNNEEYKKIIDNYIKFCEVLFNIFEGNFEDASERMNNIFNVAPDNFLIKNNKLILELYVKNYYNYKSLRKVRNNFLQLRDPKCNEDCDLNIINHNIQEMHENKVSFLEFKK